ncbi:MAG: hypothetical protein AAF360_01840, partial [Pseudomonadota bacterium]
MKGVGATRARGLGLRSSNSPACPDGCGGWAANERSGAERWRIPQIVLAARNRARPLTVAARGKWRRATPPRR